VGSYSYDVTRELTNATWYPQKSVVQYNSTYTYTASDSSNDNAGTTMKTINMGAYDVWQQMQGKPEYYQAWQAMTQAYELMATSDFVNRQYAYNGLNYFFNDYASVQTYVLPDLTELQQSTVYNDPNYGMSTITGLSKWMGASRPGYHKLPNSTPEYVAIQAHFAEMGIDLTDAIMDFATGKGSMMMSVSAAIEFAILRDPALNLHSRDLALDDVLQSQWGFSGSTSGIGTTLNGVAEIYSVASLSDIFPYAPEFGAYVLDPTRGNSTTEFTLNADSSENDF